MTRLYTAKNVDRIRVIQSYLSGQYTRRMAAINLNVTERQITRIVQKYMKDGPDSVIHGNTGKPAMNKHPDIFRQQIMSLYKDKYGKNGVRLNFCHFKDNLENDGIYISYSSLRRILIEGGIKPPDSKVTKIISPPRPRRIFAGELLQMDASIHRWLYKDYHSYALHGAIDDATGIITGLWLERAENMHGYQMILYQTIKHYGIPKCFYTDNRSVFENPKEKTKKTTKSSLKSPRFKALLTQLGIDIITTSNPRAKGRIERVWRTLQSRLLNELYLRKISNIEEANAFIQEYLSILNQAFASSINPNRNSFRKVPVNYNYNQNLALFKEVKLHNGCYIVLSNHYFVIKDFNTAENDRTIPIPDKVLLYEFLDSSYHVLFNKKWYDLEDVGPRSIHKELISEERTINAKKANTPWRQFNPNFTNRDRAKWDDENLRARFMLK